MAFWSLLATADIDGDAERGRVGDTDAVFPVYVEGAACTLTWSTVTCSTESWSVDSGVCLPVR